MKHNIIFLIPPDNDKLSSIFFFFIILAFCKVISFSLAVKLIILCAFSRGILRYIEQACNHYIAFKVLAHIRHLVFEKLRELAPAKLENEDKGNIIAMLTSDVELLEVFFAHTISPVMIAFIYSIIIAQIKPFYNIGYFKERRNLWTTKLIPEMLILSAV